MLVEKTVPPVTLLIPVLRVCVVLLLTLIILNASVSVHERSRDLGNDDHLEICLKLSTLTRKWCTILWNHWYTSVICYYVICTLFTVPECPSNCQYCELPEGSTNAQCIWGGCIAGHVMKPDRQCDGKYDWCQWFDITLALPYALNNTGISRFTVSYPFNLISWICTSVLETINITNLIQRIPFSLLQFSTTCV